MDDKRSQLKLHLFICNNKRNSQKSCGGTGADLFIDYARSKFRKYNSGECSLIVSKSGCLGQCEKGPVMAIDIDSVPMSA